MPTRSLLLQKADLKKALYTGTVYIEKEGFALLGADFEINPAYLDIAAEDNRARKKAAGCSLNSKR